MVMTIGALSRRTRAGMSRTSFTTAFHAATGESPMRCLAKVRLGQAAGHLATAAAPDPDFTGP